MEKMIGQMLMFGFRESSLVKSNPVVPMLEKHNLGGVVLFSYNDNKRPRNIDSPEQLPELTNQLKDIASGQENPLLIAIDEEGGIVSRLKPELGFPVTVSNKKLGLEDSEEYTRSERGKTARLLKEMGINLNFAPVVDLETNLMNPIVAKCERSFGEDEELVTKHAAYTIEEHNKNNVLTCLKHFPGHGSSTADTHLGFTDVSDTWNDKELEPYYELIQRKQAHMIMTAHIFNRKLDDKYPATLSEKVIKGILRENLKYDGVVITDCLQMKAISNHYSLDETIERAVNSGVDILLFANTMPYSDEIFGVVFKRFCALVQQKRIPEKCILEANRRITELKTRLESGLFNR